MEIKIDRDELFKSVSRLQSIIERKTNMPILSTILFSAEDGLLTLSATDLELGFQQRVNAEILEPGSITLSGRKLFEIVKESRRSTFHIEEKEKNWISISDGTTRFNLASLPPDEYPSFMEPEGVQLIEIDGEVISEMVNKTVYAVTVEEAGFKLSGVFIEKVTREDKSFLRMVATDGHRLGMVDKSIPEIDTLELGNGVMIPKKGMLEINKLALHGGPVRVGFKDKTCVIKRENSLLVIRLLETKFPDYRAVIPEEEKHTVYVDRTLLLEAMRKMIILSNERYRAVRVSLENNQIELVSTNPDIGEGRESLEVEYQGGGMEGGFNPRYFIDALQNMESDRVILSFIDNSKPCILKGEGDQGFLGLIMPMRV